MPAHLTSRQSLVSLMAALSAMTMACMPAFAASDGIKTVTREVSVAGLNLARPADQEILRHRVTIAAHQVCRYLEDSYPVGGDSQDDCFREVRAAAWTQAEAKIAAAQGRAIIAFIPE